MHYTILYRGPLSSCNYGCSYCPFAKRRESEAELDRDRSALGRFVDWVCAQGDRGHEIAVLFTPWGEALTRRWYQDALVRLTHQHHVRRAAIQTNLACRLGWIRRCDTNRLALWCSYHPTQTTRARFITQCSTLDALDVRYSVGIVGVKEQIAEVYALRRELRPDVYLWVNAIKRMDAYYTAAEADALAALDPLFPINNIRHPSLGRDCRAGNSVFSVDGGGTIRRCHFIDQPIGNIHDEGWERALSPSPCTNQMCGCHIGYVHMPGLELYEVFGEGILERIPRQRIWNASVSISPCFESPSALSAGRSIMRMSLRQISGNGR